MESGAFDSPVDQGEAAYDDDVAATLYAGVTAVSADPVSAPALEKGQIASGKSISPLVVDLTGNPKWIAYSVDNSGFNDGDNLAISLQILSPKFSDWVHVLGGKTIGKGFDLNPDGTLGAPAKAWIARTSNGHLGPFGIPDGCQARMVLILNGQPFSPASQITWGD